MNDCIETNENYWDCECETNYIHSKSNVSCQICGCNAEEMPDSRQNEINQTTGDGRR